jgi:transcription elongation factor Elf1
MQSIPTNAKKIKITFVCDVCGVDTICETNVPSNDIFVNVLCPVCYKEFTIKVTPTGIEIPDIEDSNITIDVI